MTSTINAQDKTKKVAKTLIGPTSREIDRSRRNYFDQIRHESLRAKAPGELVYLVQWYAEVIQIRRFRGVCELGFAPTLEQAQEIQRDNPGSVVTEKNRLIPRRVGGAITKENYRYFVVTADEVYRLCNSDGSCIPPNRAALAYRVSHFDLDLALEEAKKMASDGLVGPCTYVGRLETTPDQWSEAVAESKW